MHHCIRCHTRLVSLTDLSHQSLPAQSYRRPETGRRDDVRPVDGRTLGGVVTEMLVVGKRQAWRVLDAMCQEQDPKGGADPEIIAGAW